MVDSEILRPRPGVESSAMQFVVYGKCGHVWKMSQEEMGVEFHMQLIKEPLWQRMSRIFKKN
jgi:hypothetical protein